MPSASKIVLMLAGLALATACGGNNTSNNTNNTTPDESKDLSVDVRKDVDLDKTQDVPPESDTTTDSTDEGADKGTDEVKDNDPLLRTLSDYRRCASDNDCPVGLGSCVKEVALSHTGADGVDRVSISNIFPQLAADEGVCTLVCTNDSSVCGSLSMNGDITDPAPHVCQLVAISSSPYPETPPAFPFADQLDADALAQGQPFGALCRPPFQLDPDMADSMCQVCDPDAQGCGDDALCWRELDGRAALGGESGLCVSTCDASGSCPLGFACEQIDVAGTPVGHCMPELNTCTTCQDVDDDGVGAGRCINTITGRTGVDCDDRNPVAYYDENSPNHAFPTHCGEYDYNCNGLSDAAEQIGSSNFGDDHCGACQDSCSGVIPGGDASKGCTPDGLNMGEAVVPGTCKAQCDDPTLKADCDGDISNGCETDINDPSRVYYQDLDNDGRGNPNITWFKCGADPVPAGYILGNSNDCDDSRDTVYGIGSNGEPAALEVCDGFDNDCDGLDDDADTVDQVGASCTATVTGDLNATELLGACALSTYTCQGGQLQCPQLVQPAMETCNNTDDDCDGDVDLPLGPNVPGGSFYYPDADSDGYTTGDANSSRRACAPFTDSNNGLQYKTLTPQTDCNDMDFAVKPGQPEICNGVDTDCSGVVDDNITPSTQISGSMLYYADSDNDTYGSSVTPGSYQCPGYVAQYNTNNIDKLSSNNGDCDDNNNQIRPNATETCATPYDDNCDGDVHLNANGSVIAYEDNDNDRYGTNASARSVCLGQVPYANYVVQGNDCQDNNSSIYPLSSETCNGILESCTTDGRSVVDRSCPVEGTGGWTVNDGNPYGNQPLARYDSNGDGTLDATTMGDGRLGRVEFCPTGQVMTGLRIRYSEDTGFLGRDRVVGLGFYCNTPEVSNTNMSSSNYTYISITHNGIASSWSSVPSTGFFGEGYGGDTTAFSDYEVAYSTCDVNSMITGMRFHASPLIMEPWLPTAFKNLGGKCTKMDISPQPASFFESVPTDLPVTGSFFNTLTNVKCESGRVAVGVGIYFADAPYQNWLSGLSLQCAPLRINPIN